MKFREVKEANWTNYYIQLKNNIRLPYYSLDDPENVLECHELNTIILGKPGNVSITRDLDLFMSEVRSISFMKDLDLSKECYKDFPIKFEEEIILDWIENNYKESVSKRLKNREV